jgi:hypothetical protein
VAASRLLRISQLLHISIFVDLDSAVSAFP